MCADKAPTWFRSGQVLNCVGRMEAANKEANSCRGVPQTEAAVAAYVPEAEKGFFANGMDGHGRNG